MTSVKGRKLHGKNNPINSILGFFKVFWTTWLLYTSTPPPNQKIKCTNEFFYTKTYHTTCQSLWGGDRGSLFNCLVYSGVVFQIGITQSIIYYIMYYMKYISQVKISNFWWSMRTLDYHQPQWNVNLAKIKIVRYS